METDSDNSLKEEITTLISRLIESEDISQLLTEGFEIVGDTLTVYSLAKGIYRTVENIKIKAFLTQLHHFTYQNHKGKSIHVQKISDYLSNKRTLEIIAEAIDASLHSQSVNCSALLGIFAGGLLTSQREIDYQDYVIINTLRLMNDRDLNNFFILYNLLEKEPDIGLKEGMKSRRILDFPNGIFEQKGIRPFDIEMTIEKLKSVQAIGYDTGGFLSVLGNAWGAFLFNENSVRLFNLIELAKSKNIINL